MDRIRIVGGHELRGEIAISGAKNAALPLMIASLLTADPLTLRNVPRLADVKQLERILENHGVDVAVHGRRSAEKFGGQTMTLQAAEIVDTTAPYELVSVMRASFWVIGPLLARCTTVIENAAMEPEIDNVANCLVAMGAKISGIGTRTLTIEGVPSLHGATIDVIPDRIETGAFAMATALTGGAVLLRNARAAHLQAALDVLGLV